MKLANLISLEYGKGLKKSERRGGQFPVLGSNGIIGWHDEYLVKGPGIVIGRKGSIGEVCYVKENFWPIDTSYYVRTKQDINLTWLAFHLERIDLKRLSLADVVPGLKRELVYNQKVDVPPLSEQKAIAEILSTVDEAIQKADEAIKKTERIKQGVMHKLLTEGIGHKEFKQTKIGKFPNSWKLYKLEELFTLSSGKARPKDKSDNRTDTNKYPIYGGNGVLGYTNRHNVASTAIVIGRVGEYCGAVHLSETKSWISDNALYTKSFENANKYEIEYLATYLSFLRLNRLRRKSGQPLITQTIINNIEIGLPSLDEQQKITSIINDLSHKLNLCYYRKQKLERIKLGLMNDLLTGKKRVRLN